MPMCIWFVNKSLNITVMVCKFEYHFFVLSAWLISVEANSEGLFEG